MPTLVSTGQLTIVDVNDGTNFYLTNNSAVLPADSAGTVSSYLGAETFFKVVEANADTTNNWSFYVSATGGGVAYRDSDDAADRTGTGTADGGLGGTNLVTYSEQFDNAAWTKTASTIVANATTAPDGTLTADKLQTTAVTARISVYRAMTVTAGVKNVISLYVKAAEWSRVCIFHDATTFSEGAYYGSSTYIDLLTGVSSNPAIATATSVGNGWYRVTTSATPTGTSHPFSIVPLSTGSNVNAVPGDGTSGIYIWGAQFEAGGTPTEYSATTTPARSGTRGYLKITSLTQDLTYLDITATKIGGQSITQRYSVARAKTGVTGTRGTITTSAATAGTVWVDSEANTAISTAGGGSPLAGDVVTLYNSASAFSQTRVRTSGGAWAALAAFFGGDVLVDGTLGAAKLAANSVTANKIAAGAVTASKISVGDFAVQVRNWDFEEGDTQWTKEGTWAIALNAGQAKSGSYVATVTGAGGALRNSQYVATEPGETFYAEAYFKFAAGTAGTTAAVRIQCTDSVGTEIIAGTGNTIPVATTSYTKSSVQVTIPANAVRARIELICGTLTAGAAYADEARMFRVSNATLIADGAITTAKLTANAVTAAKIAANTITASQIAANTITAGQVAAGAIGATQIAAGAVRAQHLLVAPKSLNLDPSFEGGSTVWTGFVQRLPKANAAVPANCPVAYASQFNARDNPSSAAIEVVPGEVYRASCWVNQGTGSGGAGIGIYGGVRGADGSTVATFAWPGTTTTSTGWVRVTGLYTIPANGATLIFGPWADRTTYTGEAWYADLNVEKVNDASLIVDGAITATKIAANAIAVGTAAIQNGAIVNAMLGTASVDNAKIADLAVTTAKIADANITTAKIATANITTALIADANITTAKIGDAQITAAKIVDATITTAKIGDAQVTNAKIGGAIQSTNYVAGSAGWSIDKAGTAEFNTGTFRGAVNVGAFTGYAWPATGVGAHLSSSGFLIGNPNGAAGGGGGKYFQIATGGVGAEATISTNIPAYLADLQVTTAKIGNNQVTFPIGAYTQGTQSFAYSLTEITIQTVTITSTGAPIIILAGGKAYSSVIANSQTGYLTVKLKRGTTVLQTRAFQDTAGSFGGISTGGQLDFSPIIETPAAGTYTYTMTMQQSGSFSASNQTAIETAIILVEAKR